MTDLVVLCIVFNIVIWINKLFVTVIGPFAEIEGVSERYVTIGNFIEL